MKEHRVQPSIERDPKDLSIQAEAVNDDLVIIIIINPVLIIIPRVSNKAIYKAKIDRGRGSFGLEHNDKGRDQDESETIDNLEPDRTLLSTHLSPRSM
jgi:hypothetical protein